MGRTVEMIDARRNLALKMKAEGRGEDKTYEVCRALKCDEYVTEICNAENAIERFVKYYHAKESDCPDSFKFMMLLNGWKSPFAALNELIKVIERNEQLLKRKRKETGIKPNYRSRLREMRGLIQRVCVWHGQTEGK